MDEVKLNGAEWGEKIATALEHHGAYRVTSLERWGYGFILHLDSGRKVLIETRAWDVTGDEFYAEEGLAERMQAHRDKYPPIGSIRIDAPEKPLRDLCDPAVVEQIWADARASAKAARKRRDAPSKKRWWQK